MSTLPLLDPAAAFDGKTYDAARDFDRLDSQLTLVRQALAGHAPMTLSQIQCELARKGCHAGVASISARIRDLRKKRFGAHKVTREYVGDGLWVYQMTAGME